MHFISALIVASCAALIVAAPAPAPEPVHIGLDDVILYGEGRYQIFKRSEIEELQQLRDSGVVPPKPNELEENMYVVSGGKNMSVGVETEAIEKRDGQLTLFIPNKPIRFLGWDVLMSSVTRGGPEKTRITVTSGYTISNSISVGVSTALTLVEKYLTVTTSIDFTQSWSSDQSQQFSGEVPYNKYGAFVSNAWTDRQSGKVWTGKLGVTGTSSYYQADSLTPKQFGKLRWVDGMITLCVKDTFPMPRCIGNGTL